MAIVANSRHWIIGLILGCLVGVVVAGLAMYVAWMHNPQGEIHGASGVHWGYWLFIGLGWFASISIPISAILGSLLYLASRRSRP